MNDNRNKYLKDFYLFTQVAFSIGKFFYLLELCVFENDGYLKSEFVLGHYNFQVMKR
jgi:hypothetical protein